MRCTWQASKPAMNRVSSNSFFRDQVIGSLVMLTYFRGLHMSMQIKLKPSTLYPKNPAPSPPTGSQAQISVVKVFLFGWPRESPSNTQTGSERSQTIGEGGNTASKWKPWPLISKISNGMTIPALQSHLPFAKRSIGFCKNRKSQHQHLMQTRFLRRRKSQLVGINTNLKCVFLTLESPKS